MQHFFFVFYNKKTAQFRAVFVDLAVAVFVALKCFTFCFRCCFCHAAANCDMTGSTAVIAVMVNTIFYLTANPFNFVHRFHTPFNAIFANEIRFILLLQILLKG